MAFAKSILDYVAFVIPFYTEAYIALIIALGFFGGAEMLYKQVIGPLLLKYEGDIDQAMAKAKAAAAEATGGALKSE